jgi:hypothetical protein
MQAMHKTDHPEKEQPKDQPAEGFTDGFHWYDAQGYDENGIHYYTHYSAMRGRRYS